MGSISTVVARPKVIVTRGNAPCRQNHWTLPYANRTCVLLVSPAAIPTLRLTHLLLPPCIRSWRLITSGSDAQCNVPVLSPRSQNRIQIPSLTIGSVNRPQSRTTNPHGPLHIRNRYSSTPPPRQMHPRGNPEHSVENSMRGCPSQRPTPLANTDVIEPAKLYWC